MWDYLQRKLGIKRIMATLADVQAKQAATDTAIATVKTDVETLLAKIATFPTGGLTPDQQAAVDDIAAHADKINASLGGIDTEVNPVVPTPQVPNAPM